MVLKNLIRPISRWKREWALVDSLCISISVLISVFYFFTSKQLSQDSLLHSYVPNIATEILGVWLSVRIIDQIIQKRETYHSIRKEIIREFEYLESEFSRFLQGPYEYRLSTIDQHLSAFRDVFPYLRKYFSDSEQLSVKQCFDSGTSAVSLCNNYFMFHSKLQQTEQQVRASCDEINSHRSKLNQAIYRYLTASEARSFEQPIEAKTIIDYLKNAFSHSEQLLTPTEMREFKEIADFFDGRDQLSLAELTAVKVGLNSYGDHFSYSSRKWYRQGEGIRDAIAAGFLDSAARERALRLEDVLAAELDEIPVGLIADAREFTAQLASMVAVAAELQTTVSTYTEVFDHLRSDISLETNVVRQIASV